MSHRASSEEKRISHTLSMARPIRPSFSVGPCRTGRLYALVMLAALSLWAAKASAFVLQPLDDGTVLVTLTVLSDTMESARAEASRQAVRASVGRVFWGDDLIVAQELLTNYIDQSAERFVKAIETLKTEWVEGKPQIHARVFVDYQGLEKDLRDKRFVYTPLLRPYLAVFLAEMLETQYAKYSTGRQSLGNAFKDRNLLRPYEGTLDRPPTTTDVAADSVLLKDALIACERRGIEVMISGTSITRRQDVKDLYYDTYFFYATELTAVMIRVDTGEELARVRTQGSAADVEEQRAIDQSIERAAGQAVAQMAESFDKVWPYTVLNQGEYRILLTGITPESLALTTLSLERISREAKVFLRQQYDRSAVLSVVYAGAREDVIKTIASNTYPTLSLIPAPSVVARLQGDAQVRLVERYDVSGRGSSAPEGASDSRLISYRYETTLRLQLRDAKTGNVVIETQGRGESTDLVETVAVVMSWRRAFAMAMSDMIQSFPRDIVEVNLQEAVHTLSLDRNQKGLAASLVPVLKRESPLAKVTQSKSVRSTLRMEYQVQTTTGGKSLLGTDTFLPDATILSRSRVNWLEVQVSQ